MGHSRCTEFRDDGIGNEVLELSVSVDDECWLNAAECEHFQAFSRLMDIAERELCLRVVVLQFNLLGSDYFSSEDFSDRCTQWSSTVPLASEDLSLFLSRSNNSASLLAASGGYACASGYACIHGMPIDGDGVPFAWNAGLAIARRECRITSFCRD